MNWEDEDDGRMDRDDVDNTTYISSCISLF